MESLPEIDVGNSSPSELLASSLNITIQQNVNGDNSSSTQEPIKTIPVEQIDHKNAKSQKKENILILKLINLYGIWCLPSFHKTIKTR